MHELKSKTPESGQVRSLRSVVALLRRLSELDQTNQLSSSSSASVSSSSSTSSLQTTTSPVLSSVKMENFNSQILGANCWIFGPAFGCSAPQMLVEIVNQHFFCKKAQKCKKLAANFCKKHVFLSLHPNAGRLF